jgi:hypothetical protein
VAVTTVVGNSNDMNRAVGTNIYGCMEAGFSSQQDNVISRIAGAGSACSSDPTLGYLPAGVDTQTAGSMMAEQCGIDNEMIDLDDCGGHVPGAGYHLHEVMGCLYDIAATGHSTQIGQAVDRNQYLYGKFEDTNVLPDLDACGGHFGVTPDSNGATVYHYHLQDAPPFSIACYGPDMNDNNEEILVTTAKCRELFASECGSTATIHELTVKGGAKVQYKYDCPCFDGAGSNVGPATRAVFANGTEVTNPNPSPSPAGNPNPSPSPAGDSSGAPALIGSALLALLAFF